MSEKTERPPSALELRNHAEERLRTMQETHDDSQRLLHELHVHQIELEIQNNELRRARDEMEQLLEKYTDLYDFAPVGYFSLNVCGKIQEANLTSSILLGVERSKLVGQYLPRFATPECEPVFQSFLEQIFSSPEGKSCEVIFMKADGTSFWVACHGTSSFYTHTPHDWCRVAVSDITAQRQGEEAQLHLNSMSIANQILQKEIEQRKVVEEELRMSEKETAALLAQSLDLQDQLRSLSRRFITIQEEERKRISRELHDEITQTLISINVHLETLSKEAIIHPRDLRKSIAQTQKKVAQSVDIVHRFAQELRPPVLDDLGLIPVLKAELQNFMKKTGVRVSLNVYAGVKNLDIEKRAVLYRVAQEALVNIDRHAHASRVEISIRQLDQTVLMQIKDDGRSFKVDEILHAKKVLPLGLFGMRERLEMIGGTFSIDSSPADGTTIHAAIPLEELDSQMELRP